MAAVGACEVRAPRSRIAALAAVLALVGAFGLTSCSESAADSIDYAVDGTLITYNTNTVAGAASGGPQAFARVLTGFNYHGPDGQIVGDHDFGSISVVGRTPLVLDYEINPNAVYSDGKPITCDDMVLAWASQSGRFPWFDAANRAGYTDIATIDCAPGQKKARVSFAQDRGVHRLRPAVRRDVDDAVARDRRRARPGRRRRDDGVAQQRRPGRRAHRQGLEHHLGPDPGPGHQTFPVVGSLQAGFGDRRRAPWSWWPTTSGGAPSRSPARITVWPRSADMQDRVNEGAYDVVDIAAGSSGTLNLPDDYVRTDAPSAGVEQLIFAPQGPLAAVPARRALALCTPRDVIARNATVPVANSRLNAATEDAYGAAEAPPEAGQFAVANPDAGPRRAQRPAPDRPDRLSDTERPARRHGRRHREVLRACRHHGRGRRRREHRPAGVA